ncbi:MAG: ABC transporter substrate-binding protein [Acidimicrobiia bacterium]|nr:ABC transporter substrate-binding protein [Acidimicrobiia bacterium]
MIADLERVTAPGYLADLDRRDMDEIRSMREECQSLENGLSYVRRLAQGRVDIVGGEMARRRTEDGASSVSDLVTRLPETLSDSGHPAGAPAGVRPPLAMDDNDSAVELEALLNQILPASSLAALAELDDAELRLLLDDLQQFEQAVSESRQTLHGLIDHLQADITRRYVSGEASIDTLLR